MKWFYQHSGKEIGPISETALHELLMVGAISDETFVRREDSSKWAPLAETFGERPPGLTVAAESGAPESAMKESPVATDGIQHPQTVAGTGTPSKKRGSKKRSFACKRSLQLTVLSIVLLVLGVIAVSSVRNAYHKSKAVELVEQADRFARAATGNKGWERTVAHLQEATALGSHEAEFKLASCYLSGRGVSRNIAEARNLFKRSAEGGFAEAQYNLSVSYAKGDGVKKSEGEMLKWLKLAADQNFPQALHSLGVFYLSGQVVPQDKAKGIELITSAANQGFAQAQYELSLCFELGNGVPVDLVQSCKWAILSANSGLSDGDEAVRELQSKLSAEQVETAEQLARDWKL